MTAAAENPFPFKCKLKSGETEIIVDVLQVGHGGMRIDSHKTPLAVNKVFDASFVFPITNKTAEVTVVVFKSYAEIVDEIGQPRTSRHMNEIVFKNPTKAFNELLILFLATFSHRSKV